MSPWGKSIRKKLADCVTVTILIGICSLASVKKHPHKKPFNSARCSHGLTQQTLPQWDLFIPYLNKELFKVLFFSAVQLTLIKRGKYTAKVTHSHCASAVGWTFWMCGCSWLIEILSFVEEVKQGRTKRGKEDKIATKKEEKKDKEGKKSRGSSGKSVGVGMLGEPWVLGNSVIHPEVAYPEFKLISNPVKEVLLLGGASCSSLSSVLTYVPFFIGLSLIRIIQAAESWKQKMRSEYLPFQCRTQKGEQSLSKEEMRSRRWKRELHLQMGQTLLRSRWTLFRLKNTGKSSTLKWVWPKFVSLSWFCCFLVRHTEAQGER